MPVNTAMEEIIHGIAVHDPYRWLEDRGSSETNVWIREQQQRSNAYFSMCPALSAIESRVLKFLDVCVIGIFTASAEKGRNKPAFVSGKR